MTDNLKDKTNKGVKDGRIAVHPVSDKVKTGDHKPVSGDSRVYPQTRDSEVTTSINQENLHMPPVRKINTSCRIS